MDPNALIEKWQQLIQRAWREPAFKARLIGQPKAVLAEVGIPIPADVELTILEDTPTLRHLVLDPPAEGHVADAQLDHVHGGRSSMRNDLNWKSKQ